MKILELLLTFLGTQGKAFFETNTQAVGEHIAKNARRVAILISANVVAIVLFCTGFKMAYVEAVANFKDGYGWSLTPGFLGGIILTVAASLALIWCLSEPRWRHAVGLDDEPEKDHRDAPASSPIESAIALILVEIAHEMRHRRQSPASDEGESEK